MKKFLFLLTIAVGLCACTTPEEDAQIKLFWLEQMMQFMPHPPRPVQPLPAPVQPPTEPPLLPDEVATQPTQQNTPTANQQSAVSTTAKQPSARRAQSQFLEITLEDTTRVNPLKSNAPLKERQAMQRALENVKQANQQALRDIGIMFDGDTQAQAFAIVAKSEKILMRTANTSNNYQNYLNAQRKILQEQDQQLNQLMRQNAYKLRRIRS